MISQVCLTLLAAALMLPAADAPPARQGGARQPTQISKCNEVPPHPFNLILGRPTADSIQVSVICHADTTGWLAYGTQSGKLDRKSPDFQFKRGEPVEIQLSNLAADTRYYYQLRLPGTNSAEFTFHTARPPGSSFVFTITADSHLDEQTDPQLYGQTLANALAGKPDFHIDLGDTFMTEKHPTRDDAARQYLAQRYYLGQICHSSPFFFVLGNHDGEAPRGRGGSPDDLAVWSNTMRKRYFPNPVPGGFYSGSSAPHAQAGLLQNYYAWQWADALFVVLDPFWYSQRPGRNSSNWASTLGQDQYQWLKRTLEASRARFKFVFIHHLVGGADSQCRGGAEAVPFFEWGGKHADGTDGFRQNRPGWPMPIHRLLLENKVNIVFHGHDHLYASQELDGIVYQEVPQPGHPGDNRPPRFAADYGYKSGTILGGSGHLRVAVNPAEARVEYRRSNPTEMGTVAHEYKVLPK